VSSRRFEFAFLRKSSLSDYPEQYLEIPQIQVLFKGRGELEAEDIELLSQCGIQVAPDQTYPVIRSVHPSYRPWHLEDNEVQFLLCVLGQAVEVLPRAMRDPSFLIPQPPDRFPIRVQNADGKDWRDDLMRIPQPGPEPILYMMDVPLMEQVQRLPHSERDIEIDFFLVQRVPPHWTEAGQRPRYPYMLLTVDAILGLIMGQEILSASPTLESMVGLLGWKLVVQFDKFGAIPRRVWVRSPLLKQVFAMFSQTLGFELKEVEILPGVDAAKALLDHLANET
jgi:hypothetical protein